MKYSEIIQRKCKIWKQKISLFLVVKKFSSRKFYFQSKWIYVKIVQSNFFLKNRRNLRKFWETRKKIIYFHLVFLPSNHVKEKFKISCHFISLYFNFLWIIFSFTLFLVINYNQSPSHFSPLSSSPLAFHGFPPSSQTILAPPRSSLATFNCRSCGSKHQKSSPWSPSR